MMLEAHYFTILSTFGLNKQSNQLTECVKTNTFYVTLKRYTKNTNKNEKMKMSKMSFIYTAFAVLNLNLPLFLIMFFPYITSLYICCVLFWNSLKPIILLVFGKEPKNYRKIL